MEPPHPEPDAARGTGVAARQPRVGDPRVRVTRRGATPAGRRAGVGPHAWHPTAAPVGAALAWFGWYVLRFYLCM